MARNVQPLAALLTLLVLSGCGQNDVPTWTVASQGLYTARISQDGSHLVVGSMNHGASLWRLSDHERLFNWSHKAGEPAELTAAAFASSSARAVTADARTLVIWDTTTGASLAYWATPGEVMDVALLPNGFHVLLGQTDHTALLFDADSGAYLKTFIHEGPVATVAISGDGTLALTGSDDEQVVLWNVADGNARVRLAFDNPVRKVALSDDGTLIFAAAQNRAAGVWDATTGQLKHLIFDENPGITSARFSPDGAQLLLGFVNRRVLLVDTSSGRTLADWSLPAPLKGRLKGAAVLDVAFLGGSNRIGAITGDGRLLELTRR